MRSPLKAVGKTYWEAKEDPIAVVLGSLTVILQLLVKKLGSIRFGLKIQSSPSLKLKVIQCQLFNKVFQEVQFQLKREEGVGRK